MLDAEVGNSTSSELFLAAAPERYFQAFIAEQLMFAAASGFAVRGYVPFAATFGAFVSRGFDFLRMSGISEVSIRLAGSHAGVEIGPDGPSQMALEDLAAMRAVYGSTVLYPADAASAAALTVAMADRAGVSYLRTTRGAYPVIYGPDEEFPIGGAKVVRAGSADAVTLVGAGITVHESLAAAERLAAEGIAARVIDCYSVKPIDSATLVASCDGDRGTDRRHRGPLPRRRSRRGSALGPCRGRGQRRTSRTSRCARSPSRERRPSSSVRRASRPPTSPPRHARLSTPEPRPLNRRTCRLRGGRPEPVWT